MPVISLQTDTAMSDQPKADTGKISVSNQKFKAVMLETSSENPAQPIETEQNFNLALTQTTKVEDSLSSVVKGQQTVAGITPEAPADKAGSATAQNESPPNTIVNPLRLEGILGAGQASPAATDAIATAAANKVSPAISPPSIPGINASIGETKNTPEGNPEGGSEEETPIKIETRNEGESPRKGEGNAPIPPTPGKDSSTITLMQSPTREASSAPVTMSDAMITPNLASAAIAQATPPSLLENSVVQRPLLTLSMQEPAQAANALARVIMTQSGMGDRVSVQLDPPELGRLNLDFVFDGNRLQSVHVISDTPEMQQFLKRQSALLSQILADSGFGEASLSFENQRQQHNPFMDRNEKILSAHIQQTDETTMVASVIGDIPAPTNYSLSSDPIDIRA
jgi:flagellar hook-length control protein FliK